jgi:hypothetical protein
VAVPEPAAPVITAGTSLAPDKTDVYVTVEIVSVKLSLESPPQADNITMAAHARRRLTREVGRKSNELVCIGCKIF